MKQGFSRIIQGCMNWGAWGKKLSANEMSLNIERSVNNGITTFDHADIYGDYTTEKEFGRAFSEMKIPRDALELISKCGIQYIGNTRNNSIKHYQYDSDYIIWSAEKSIKELQCDYLDLFLLHRPSPLMHPDEIAKAIEHLKDQGKIKAFGVSNFTSSQTELIASRSVVEVNQIEFSLTSHEALHNGSLDYMLANNITPMCWSPLGVIFKEQNEQIRRIDKILDELTETYSATKDQLMLAWILKHPAQIHPVIGTTDPQRMRLAAEAINIPLTEIDWFRLLVASQGHKVP